MSQTINQVVSRVRSSLKSVKEDAFLTDRYLWSVCSKYAKMYIKRQDGANKAKRFASKYKTIPFLDLVETDKVKASCSGIKTGCIIMRTKEEIPKPFDGDNGPMFRTVSTIDGSMKFFRTTPAIYTSITKSSTFKFNKRQYYWFIDNYMYFPDTEIVAVSVEGVWDEDIRHLLCPDDENLCTSAQDADSNVPDDLFAYIEGDVRNEILATANIPAEDGDNKNNILR